MEKLIHEYTRETGVRGLEKQLKALSRGVALKVAKGEKSSKTVKPGDLKSLLGPALFPKDAFKSPEHPGIAQGLAWTPSGGSILNIEAIALQGEKAELKLTGQLGEVMQESSKIAHSLVRSILNEQKDNRIGLDQPVHLHVPEGATPKDGPSAGISMATAIHSLALKKTVKKDLAMTGELTLTGQVLPVGGIREKLVGARLGGIKQIILPRANKPQYEELPDYIKEDIQIEFVERYAEVSSIALGIEPEEK